MFLERGTKNHQSKKILKKLKKRLDKWLLVWYNKYVLKRGTKNQNLKGIDNYGKNDYC
jgi:hypothetical protein